MPHNDLEATLLAYKSWEVEQGNVLDVNSANLDGISSHVASAYQKALGMYNARVQLEEQVSKQDLPDSERLKLFMVCDYNLYRVLEWELVSPFSVSWAVKSCKCERCHCIMVCLRWVTLCFLHLDLF